ncbi:MAG: xanthine dehydrogenase small subunit [Betaproteobacteria bacterium]
MSEPVRILLNGERVDVAGVPPQTTLLEFLRDRRRLTGTKEGCAEGDCGACTVVVAEARGTVIRWNAINACLRLLPSLDGKAVFTVESLARADGALHPVQQALVDCHASQCGFCTPGFAMSLFALYKRARRPTRVDVDDALSGNLCRCTGYRPIVDAAAAMYSLPPFDDWRAACGEDAAARADTELARALVPLERHAALDYKHAGQRWSAPRSTDELAALVSDRPAARIVAGMTDVGLWITKAHRSIDDIIYVGDVGELALVRATPHGLDIGAAVTLTDAFACMEASYPELAEVWQRFASVPIRNSATLAGNIANGSPIGDSMPVLIALGASVVLRGTDTRSVPLEAFYPAFRTTAIRPGEFVAAVHVPARTPGLVVRAYKIGKRYDQDISSVFACFAMTLDAGIVRTVRIACGGVAATPVRAEQTERVLVGSAWDADGVERAAATLAAEFTPIDDMRASAGYRRAVLGNLLRRCFHETTDTAGLTWRVESPALVAGAPS